MQRTKRYKKLPLRLLLEKKKCATTCIDPVFGSNRQTHCSKRLFFVQKLHFAVEFSIDVSDMGRSRLGKKYGEFSKNTVTP